MRIVSTTLCGVGRATEMVSALQSFSRLVDDHIVIDTAPLDDPPILMSADVKVHRWAWTGRFDEARNECLRLAAESGADWSAMVDSDEFLICDDPAAVRAFLEALDPKVQIVCVFSGDGTYQRERFFRGKIPQRWKFRTHESIDAGPGEQATMPQSLISWGEKPKTGEQVVIKSRRDAELIRADLKEYPDEPRLWFYLGNTLGHLGAEYYEEAIAAYKKVSEVGLGEGCAWACFCAARIYFEMSRIASEKADRGEEGARDEMWRCAYKALDCCSAGIHRETRIAELHWLAACINHAIGNHELGQAWARQAGLHGIDSPSYKIRHGFIVPHAVREGPEVVEAMCVASIASGDTPIIKPSFIPFASRFGRDRVHITVTGTGFRAGDLARKCIESVKIQTRKATHVYIAADDETLLVAREHKRDSIDGRKQSAFQNLIPLWRSLPPEEVVVWLDGDDYLAREDALEIVARAHEAGAWMTYGQFQWSSTGTIGFAASHDFSLPRTNSPWRATILRTFRAGLIRRIKEADLRWPSTGGYLDATLDQAIMLPCLEMCGPERATFIPKVLAHYYDGNLLSMSDEAKAHEAEALAYIRSRPMYERIGAL